jgi:hypothetical protein
MDIYKEITGLREDILSLKTMLSEVTRLVRASTSVTAQTCMKKKYLYAREAAEYLNISESTFHRHKVRLPIMKVGGRLVYKVDDLDNYLKEMTLSVGEGIDFVKIGTRAAV